jgi:hypothetical protein
VTRRSGLGYDPDPGGRGAAGETDTQRTEEEPDMPLNDILPADAGHAPTLQLGGVAHPALTTALSPQS